MNENFIFEIGTEELPSACIDEGIKSLKVILEEKLIQNRINFGEIKTYGTPRRLTAEVKNLSSMQMQREKTVTGPLKKVAFDKNNSPTKAAVGFAKSLGINVEELEEVKTKRGVYIGKKIVEEGKKTIDILPGILKDTILSLSFNKNMSWSDYSIKFARPIRWLVALYGSKPVKFTIENLISGNTTYGHRTLYPQDIFVKDADSYFKILKDTGRVIVDYKERKNMILSSIDRLEEEEWNKKFKVVLDEDLLNEVVNLVEIPNVLVGNFPERFLYIPKDILINAIQYHQKYFAVIDKAGSVSTKFVIIQNGVEDCRGEIVKGNERVLKARLGDAAFFYKEDKKHDFSYWFEKLKGVIFYSRLGSIYDKACRLEKICLYIVNLLKNKDVLKRNDILSDLRRASMLSKCDLVTNMVVEFPELQGIVGREYAKEKFEKLEVADSIFEHYLPRFSEDMLPAADIGSILSIADKIDTISGMFLVGNVPSGSEDPFALRRKAAGIVLSSLKAKYDFDISSLINYSLDLYINKFDFKDINKEKISGEIMNFIIARYRFLLEKKGKRLDILEAILAAGCCSLLDIDLRYKSMEDFVKKEDIETISTPMVRCKNIIKGKSFSKVETDLLSEKYEKKLFSAAAKKRNIIMNYVEKKEYYSALNELSRFRETVNIFFDRVLVMDKDEKIRKNRINLVKDIMDLYLLIADFSRLIMGDNNKA